MKLHAANKKIGEYDMSTNTFTSNRRRSRHLFRVLEAWGIDYKILSGTLLPINAKIKIVDTENNVIYQTDAQTFDREGEFYHFKDKQSGEDHKVQKFLKLNKFKVEKKTEEEIAKENAKRLML